MNHLLSWSLLFWISFLPHALAAGDLYPIYRATVQKVTDGDTIAVEVIVWFHLVVTVAVRVRGIDTPEVKSPKCHKERELGLQAKEFVSQLLPKGSMVVLRDIDEDKYSGRIDAKVQLPNGQDLSTLLVMHGIARPYAGTGPRPNWCESKEQESAVGG